MQAETFYMALLILLLLLVLLVDGLEVVVSSPEGGQLIGESLVWRVEVGCEVFTWFVYN